MNFDQNYLVDGLVFASWTFQKYDFYISPKHFAFKYIERSCFIKMSCSTLTGYIISTSL